MNGISLCAGIGGIDISLKIALGDAYRTVCYVELNSFSASLLVARMEDSSLDRAPIWDDIGTFDGRRWRGKVDLISAGFPCPPFSTAGRRKGSEDDRWLWPQIKRIVCEVAPEWVFLENVRGLLSCHAGREFGEILGDLASLGYDAEWDVFRARDVGATHLRGRVFILAHPSVSRRSRRPISKNHEEERQGRRASHAPRNRGTVGDAQGARAHEQEREGESHSSRADERLGHSHESGLEGRLEPEEDGDELETWPPGPKERDRWERILSKRSDIAPATQPPIRGVADGVPSRMDRICALGNAVVPMVGAVAFAVLKRRLVT